MFINYLFYSHTPVTKTEFNTLYTRRLSNYSGSDSIAGQNSRIVLMRIPNAMGWQKKRHEIHSSWNLSEEDRKSLKEHLHRFDAYVKPRANLIYTSPNS